MSNIKLTGLCVWILCMFCTLPAQAYDSGSTGADGALIPAEDTVVELPADGVLNYTEVDIPDGVTVTFKRNTANTPVRMLVSGDVIVEGTLSVNGGDAASIVSAGDGNPADDGDPGAGGPGGYDGGRGGRARPELDDVYTLFSPEDALAVSGEWGRGPGGGAADRLYRDGRTYSVCRGSVANFANPRGVDFFATSECVRSKIPVYGNVTLLPLIGGSGGGGSRALEGLNGGGGGGGGGAILIAASGAVNITGTISADGGRPGFRGRHRNDYVGYPGSGGAIRIVATTISGNGAVTAVGARQSGSSVAGGQGRIRMEAERFLYSRSRTTPDYTLGVPGPLYFTGRPSVRIVSIGGQSVPEQPAIGSDVSFAEVLEDEISISIAASNVPLDAVVSVRVIPAAGEIVISSNTTLGGTVASSTATASVVLPAGPSAVQASASFEVSGTDSAAQSLYTPYTDGELVAHVSLESGSDTGMVLTTASGRKVTVQLAR